MVSIITPCLNGASTIEDTIKSILSQSYKNIEYIIVDGGSTDGTLDIIKKYNIKYISEPDSGVYHAMNKGIKIAKGEIIGILNSDDYYANSDVIEKVVKNIKDCCWGDLSYINSRRHWKSCSYKKNLFKKGWMPPHPTFFVKKKIYDKYGFFNTNLKIAADYELMLRFLEKHKIKSSYIPKVLVKMRTGGLGSKSIVKKNIECYRAWKLNDLKINPFIIIKKPLSKFLQYLCRRNPSS